MVACVYGVREDEQKRHLSKPDTISRRSSSVKIKWYTTVERSGWKIMPRPITLKCI